MADHQLEGQVERVFYNYGLFASRHPVSMILFSAVMVFSCCYPLLNLPLPGSEPNTFFTAIDGGKVVEHNVGENIPYTENIIKPAWFSTKHQTAYIQQFLFKAPIHSFQNENPSVLLKAFLSTVFPVTHDFAVFVDNQMNSTLDKNCFHVPKTIIKPDQRIKKLFPERACLLLSPHLFWNNDVVNLVNDADALLTINQYEAKPIETSPSIREILFGIPSWLSGLNQFFTRRHNFFVTYAVTVVLKKYDNRWLNKVHQHLLEKFSKSKLDNKIFDCLKMTENNQRSCGNRSLGITHVRFKPQIHFVDLIPLLSTYFILGSYIYFSVRKINYVKSKLGMAFSAVVSVMASLMMAIGLCSLTGLTPALNRGEMFPYLVCVIGLENILVITKSVVATPTDMEVEKRIALGLSREGRSIAKNLLLEFVLIGLGYFTLIPKIQELCALALVGILSDFLMHTMFFVTVLSIDIRRLDNQEMVYSPDNSPMNAMMPMLRKTRNDRVILLETGEERAAMIPKRIKVVFFFADTRMVQRGLMISLLIWIAFLYYRNPSDGIGSHPTNPSNTLLQSTKLYPTSEPKHATSFWTSDVQWTDNDIHSFHDLGFRHWPTLFAYYNITLAERFLSILPVRMVPLDTSKYDMEMFKQPVKEPVDHQPRHENQHLNENAIPYLPSDFYTGRYQMTGLDYYITLLLGAISGMVMVFLLTIMYRCICPRDNPCPWWRPPFTPNRPTSPGSHSQSIGKAIPLILSGHSQLVEFVVVNESLIASADISGELKAWDHHSGEATCTVKRRANKQQLPADFSWKHKQDASFDAESCIWSIACFHKFVILGCDNGAIEIWDCASSELKCRHSGENVGVIGLAIEGNRLVAARMDGCLDFYEIEVFKSKPINTVQHRGPGRVRSGEVYESSREFHASDVLTLQRMRTIKSVHQQPISAFKVAMGRVLTGSCDHTLKVFTIQDGRCQYTMCGHTAPVTELCMDEDAPGGAVSGGMDGSVRLWDLLSGVCVHKLEEHKGAITAVQCSTNHVVSTGQDNKLCIWARRPGILLQVARLEPGCSGAMILMGQNSCVTAGCDALLLWDVRRGELLGRVPVCGVSPSHSVVTQIVSIGDLKVVCVIGREMRVVRFPSVVEKID